MSDQMNPKVRVARLSTLLRRKRQLEEMTLQDVSIQTGISISTLSRLEKQSKTSLTESGMITPDTRTVTALAKWLAVPMDELVETEIPGTESSTVDLPLMVDSHLRADRNLNPEDAELLSRVFRDMYENYSKQGASNRSVEK